MVALLPEPAASSVFLDFDGTISTEDVGRYVLARLAAPEWWDLHLRYERGEIGSRELLLDQWALIESPTDRVRLETVAGEVALDPGFGPLVDSLRGAGAEVTVVSDGFGFYVEAACAPFGVDVLTNAVDFSSGELHFPHEDRCCPCSTCGMCKQAPIKDAKYRKRTTVLVGDGASDRKAALLADVVLAKDELASWCAEAGLPHYPFETLDDARRLLLGESV
jgi:2-hydroxy-3-keto-5-methylthiopentenyl-1-phosphate phosphatase